MRRALAICLCWGSTAGWAHAGAGTESPFALGAGARDLALGGAALATGEFAAAPYWNPARLAQAERLTLAAFHSRLYEPGVAYQYLGLVVPTLDLGTFGLGVFRLGVDGIEQIDATGFRQGEISDHRLAFYLAYGRTLSGFDVGAATTMEHHSLAGYRATSSPGLNLSLGRRLAAGKGAFQSLTCALNLRNVLRPATRLVDESVPHPFSLQAGVSLTVAPGIADAHAVALSAAITKADRVEAAPAVGLEYRVGEWISVRAGTREGHPAFGAGLAYHSFRFDYALVDRDFGSLHLFSLTTAFGSPASERRLLRAARREAEFNRLMTSRLAERNSEQVDRLMTDARQLVAEGRLAEAVGLLDRALFLSQTADADTAYVAAWARQLRADLEAEVRQERFGAHLDSARARLAEGDLLASRYYAGQALALDSTSAPARQILSQANRALEQSAAREKTIRERILAVDSLVGYGRLDRALQIVQALNQLAPDDARVRVAYRKVHFERLRSAASSAYAEQSLPLALAAIDSALALFPGHDWCREMRGRIRLELASEPRQSQPAPDAPALSGDLQKEVETHYRSAQSAFERGDLRGAIAEWERVERLAPNYQSVRAYLINAYKYVGVEMYGQNRPEDAVAAWRKAARLDPENAEIAGYIRRTENEVRRLKELSYEP